MAKDHRARDSAGHVLHPKKRGRKKGSHVSGKKRHAKKSRDKGHVPLDILEKRLRKLTRVVASRGGEV